MEPSGSGFSSLKQLYAAQQKYYGSCAKNNNDYWEKQLATVVHGAINIVEIPNVDRLSSLLEFVRQNPQIKKLDFKSCEFSNQVFNLLINYPSKPACELVFTWSELIQKIGSQHMENITALTIFPSKANPEPIEIQNVVSFIFKFYDSHEGEFNINMNGWPEIDELAFNELAERGLKINFSDNALTDKLFRLSRSQAECMELWLHHMHRMSPDSNEFVFNREEQNIGINSPDPIHAFFEVIKHKGCSITTLNLKKILFSDEAWEAVLEGINQCNVENLCVSIFTIRQIKMLFETLTEKTLARLKTLDLSGAPFISTTEQQKEEFEELLAIQVSKLTTEIKLEQLPDVQEEEDAETSLLRSTEENLNTLKASWFRINFLSDAWVSWKFGSSGRALADVDSKDSINVFFDVIPVEKLKFTNLSFSDRAWETLLGRLVSSRIISSLRFIGCHLTSARILSLSRISSLERLTISNNAVLDDRPAFCNAILAVKKSNPNLRALTLENSLISDEEIEVIFEDSGILEDIKIGGHTLSPRGISYIMGLDKRRRRDAEIRYLNNLFSKKNSEEDALASDLNAFKLRIKDKELSSELFDDYKNSVATLSQHHKESFFRALLEINFQIIPIEADGNCFFRSCAKGMNNVISHEWLRQQTADYISENKADFENIIGSDVDEYVKELRGMKWGGEEEVTAVVRKFNIPITIYDKACGINVVEAKLVSSLVYNPPAGSLFDNPKTVFLYRSHDSHYQLLVPRGRPLPENNRANSILASSSNMEKDDMKFGDISSQEDALHPSEILTAVDKASCLEGWNRYIMRCNKRFTLYDQPFDIALVDPAPIEALFEILKKRKGTIEELDLGRIVFSDQAWKAFLQGFKTLAKDITSLTFPHATVNQLELLFNEMNMTNLIDLNISRLNFVATTENEKEEFAARLSKHCSKLKKLSVDNWGFSENQLRLDPSTIVSNKFEKMDLTLANVVISNLKTETASITRSWVSVMTADTPPVISSDAIGNLFERLDSDIVGLEFCGFVFTDESFERIINELNAWQEPPELAFERCRLTPDMIRSLPKIKKLRRLTIDSNGVLAEKEAFCLALKEVVEISTLSVLGLEKNLLDDRDISLIFQNNNSQLKTLNLAYNCITKNGMNHLKQKQRKRSHDGEISSNYNLCLMYNPVLQLKTYDSQPIMEAILDKLHQGITGVNYCDFKKGLIGLSPELKNYYLRRLLGLQFELGKLESGLDGLLLACGITEGIKELRGKIADYIEENKAYYAKMIEARSFDFEEYVKGLKEGTIRLGGMEAMALQKVLNRPIYVYQKRFDLLLINGFLETVTLRGWEGVTGEPIYVFYDDKSYQSLSIPERN